MKCFSSGPSHMSHTAAWLLHTVGLQLLAVRQTADCTDTVAWCASAPLFSFLPLRDGQAELIWVVDYIPTWRERESIPLMITHPSTNRNRRSETTLIEPNTLRQTPTCWWTKLLASVWLMSQFISNTWTLHGRRSRRPPSVVDLTWMSQVN